MYAIDRTLDAAVSESGTHAPFMAWLTILGCVVLLAGCSPRPSAVQHINEPSVGGDQVGDVSLAVDPVKHDLLMSWVAGDERGLRIWFARSADEGIHWSTPVAVTPEGEPLRLQPESSPRLVCDDRGRVAIGYSTSFEVKGQPWLASDFKFVRSLDGGATWGGPSFVNDDTARGPGRHSHFGVSQTVSGALVAAWLDGRVGADSVGRDPTDAHDASIHLARSEDFGVSWGPNVSQWARVCPSCRASVAVDPTGAFYVTFRKHYPGQIRDVVVGRPDGPTVRLYEDRWTQDSGPDASPALEMSRDGTLRMAWFTGAAGRTGVYFRQSTPEVLDSTTTPLMVLRSEQLPTVHLSLVEAGMSGTLLACDADSTGERQVTLTRIVPSGRRVAERFILPDSKDASYARLAVAPGGRKAYVAWTRRDGARTSIRMAKWDVGR